MAGSSRPCSGLCIRGSPRYHCAHLPPERCPQHNTLRPAWPVRCAPYWAAHGPESATRWPGQACRGADAPLWRSVCARSTGRPPPGDLATFWTHWPTLPEPMPGWQTVGLAPATAVCGSTHLRAVGPYGPSPPHATQPTGKRPPASAAPDPNDTAQGTESGVAHPCPATRPPQGRDRSPDALT
jgi:hypothetical protein